MKFKKSIHFFRLFENTLSYSLITNHFKRGQALVTLLVFMATAITITSGAVIVTIINSQGSSKYELGEEALQIAETGADNAILRVIREPAYSGETVSIGAGTATITVSGTSTKTIVSEGSNGGFKRKVQVVGNLTNNAFSLTSWSEID